MLARDLKKPSTPITTIAPRSLGSTRRFKATRSALYVLDEQVGLAVANQDAIDVLQSLIRSAKFLDSENFRTQLDDFEITLNELVRLGVGFSNSDKISMLQRCLQNGGIIGRLFVYDLGLLRSRVLTLAGAPVPTHSQVLDIVNRRYADLSAEAATIEIPSNREMTKVESERESLRSSRPMRSVTRKKMTMDRVL